MIHKVVFWVNNCFITRHNETTNQLTATGLKLGWQKHLLQYWKYDYCSTTYGKKDKEVTVFSGEMSVCYQCLLNSVDSILSTYCNLSCQCW